MILRRPQPGGSFAARTTAGGVCLVVAIVLLASVAFVAMHRQQRVGEVATSAHDQAVVTRNLIAGVSVPEAEATAGDLAADPALATVLGGSGAPEAQLHTLLATATPPAGMTLYVLGPDGSALASLPQLAPPWTSPASVSPVAAALAGRTTVSASPAVIGATLAEVAAAPVRSGGTTLGAVAAVVPLDAQLRRFMPAVGYPVILVPQTDVMRASISGGSATAADLGAAVGTRLAGSPSETSATLTVGGDEQILDLVALDSGQQSQSVPGYVGVLVTLPGFFDTEGTTLLVVALLAALAATVTSLAVLVVVDRWVRRPVADLERGVDRLAAEEYGTDIPVRSDDELGRLAGAFNGMARRIGEEIERSRSALVHLGWVSEALTAAGGGDHGAPGAIVRAAAAIAGDGAGACLFMAQPGSGVPLTQGDPGDVEAERAAALAMRPGIVQRQGHDGRWRSSFPLAADGDTIGGRLVVVTASPLTPDGRRVLTTLANNAAIALDHARLLEQEQDAVRRLRAAERARTEFLRTTHHELRTPLTVVLGMTDVAEASWDSVGDDERREFMTTIAAGARQLAHTIESILNVTTLSADEVTLRRRHVDVHEVAERCLDDAVHRRGLEGARTVDVDVPRDLRVDADPARFRQMLDAVIDNALKFTRVDGTIIVCARRDGHDVVIRVIDDGVGIPSEAQPRVFEHFQQAESGHVREFGGLGLGLTIAARVCSLHGARISLASTEGEGTEVLVRWPAGRDARTDAGPSRRGRPVGV